MKVAGNVTSKLSVEGTLSKEDLLALVKASLDIPKDAEAGFFVYAASPDVIYRPGAQLGVSAAVYIDTNTPLRFRITWSVPVGKDEQG